MDWCDDLHPLVIDNGTSMCKAGFAGEYNPVVLFPSIVSRHNNKVGDEASRLTVISIPTLSEPVVWVNGQGWLAIWLANSIGTWSKDAGEIDIYESVNGKAQGARTTQHTPPKCIMNGSVLGKSVLKQANCNAGSSPSFPGEGCGIEMIDTTSSQNGTFACMWLVDDKAKTGGLEFFYWKNEDNTVYDLTGVFGKFPDPTKWGQNKYGNFTMSPSLCSYDHFSSFTLIINNSYCGQWWSVCLQKGIGKD